MFYKFSSDINHRFEADKAVSPLMISESEHHMVLTEDPIVCRVPRKCRDWDILWIHYKDIKRSRYGQYVLISPRFQELLAEIEATGFEYHETDMRLAFEHEPEDRDFKQLVVTGWGGTPNKESGAVPVESDRGQHCYSPCSAPEKLLDTQQWDGTDFFRIWPVGTFVSERVGRIILDNNLKHVDLDPSNRLHLTRPIDETVGFLGTPLRHLYPETHAKEIGEPLRIY